MCVLQHHIHTDQKKIEIICSLLIWQTLNAHPPMNRHFLVYGWITLTLCPKRGGGTPSFHIKTRGLLCTGKIYVYAWGNLLLWINWNFQLSVEVFHIAILFCVSKKDDFCSTRRLYEPIKRMALLPNHLNSYLGHENELLSSNICKNLCDAPKSHHHHHSSSLSLICPSRILGLWELWEFITECCFSWNFVLKVSAGF